MLCDYTIEIDIGGSPVDQVATGLVILEMQPYLKDGSPTFMFGRVLGALPPFPDPWDNQPVACKINGTLYFSGYTGRSLSHYDGAKGWCREWTCFGLTKMAEYCPITDSNTLTDQSQFNTDPTDPNNIQSRDGRTVGQAVLEVLTMPTNATLLQSLGVGNYSSFGTGATATATVVGGKVTLVAMLAQGNGYTAAPTVRFSGGGGSGATGTAAVSGGAVTGVTITNQGSGYLEPPAVVITTLPAITVADLDNLGFLPPYPMTFSGEHILQSVEGVVQGAHPNHFLQVLPDGTIRFLDPRTFIANVNVILNKLDDDNARWDMPQITLDWSQTYTRVLVRGSSYVVPATIQTHPWFGSTATDGGLITDFAHDGLTEQQSIDYWHASDFTVPLQSQGTATGHASVSSSSPNGITAITIDIAGYNYVSPPTVLITDATGTGATATATLGSGPTAGQVTSVAITAAGSGYSNSPTVTFTGPAVGQSDVGSCTMPSTGQVVVTSANHAANWPADYWDQTSAGHQASIVLRSDTIAGDTQTYTSRIIANTLMAPGGTSTITLQVPAQSNAYNSYQIYGTAGGASFVWRRYKVTNAEVAAQMTNQFPWPVPYVNSDGTAASLVSVPQAVVQYSPSGQPPYNQSFVNVSLDPVSGTILLAKPSALVFSPDNKTPVPPSNVQAFLPVNTGSLHATYPADASGVPQYAGTAYTQLNIQRTKYLSMPSWTDYSQSSNMQLFAQEYHGTCSNVVIEGTITYHGLLLSMMQPGNGMTITGVNYSTGYESMILPVTACNVQFNQRADGGALFQTTLTFSTRRMPFTGAAFQRPAMKGQPLGFDQGMPAGLAAAAMFGAAGVYQAARTATQGMIKETLFGNESARAQFAKHVEAHPGQRGDALGAAIEAGQGIVGGAQAAQQGLVGGAMAGQEGIVGGVIDAMAGMGAGGGDEDVGIEKVSRRHGGVNAQKRADAAKAAEALHERKKQEHIRKRGDEAVKARQNARQDREANRAARVRTKAYEQDEARANVGPTAIRPETEHETTMREKSQEVPLREPPKPGTKAAEVTDVGKTIKPETKEEKKDREEYQEW